MSKKVFEIITNDYVNVIEKSIEEGTNLLWNKTWTDGYGFKAISRATGKAYRGANAFFLDPGEYITMAEIQRERNKPENKDKKIHLKKGSKASKIIAWVYKDRYEKGKDKDKEEDKDEKDKKQAKVCFARYYNVFNINDVVGLEPKYKEDIVENDFEPIEKLEKIVQDFIERTKVTIEHGKSGACYIPSQHKVQMPNMETFETIEDYYSTLFHELAHSTGHKSLLDREKHSSFGDEVYSLEELIAELTSSFCLNHVNIDTNKVTQNTTAYLRSWIKTFKSDTSMIIFASIAAEKAFNCLMGIEEEETEDKKTETA